LMMAMVSDEQAPVKESALRITLNKP